MDSSMSWRCNDSRSAEEKTPVGTIPSSRHVRAIRIAISPRLAIRTRLNTKARAKTPPKSLVRKNRGAGGTRPPAGVEEGSVPVDPAGLLAFLVGVVGPVDLEPLQDLVCLLDVLPVVRVVPVRGPLVAPVPREVVGAPARLPAELRELLDDLVRVRAVRIHFDAQVCHVIRQ